ncbi:D-2-hydroxyacid dehydrogenase family protein [Rhizobium sp. BK251]|uniref:D-2-hydroxyacid dehydrogenase family protein n=1 Tax=Rhizobium sp. BK251 TaxID=2512125 RepID=UPI00104FBE42|nr:D-2-hydroxyacid dehydrogenase family protein [Rhizobium sp. BK251]TCL71238.1 phosphoglycerate dehydrogenase-like enzyme [Rhizobium sp. BK251]
MTLNCAILDDYQQIALSMADWRALDGKVRVESFADPTGTGAQAQQRLRDYDIIVAMRERTVFDAALLEQLPKLKLLITTGMHNASIDTEAAARLGIIVAGTGGVVGPAAEIAWALLMALVRHIPAEAANFRASGERWQLSVGRGLAGKTLGVVGLGKLGKLVAGYGRAFGMEVAGWSRSNTPERSAALGIGFSPSLDDLLSRSDVVSLHLTLTPETAGIIGARELGLMKKDALLINTSRGPLVDEPALIAALEGGKIGGAGLDVFDREPLPADHPFRGLANVVATPHLGYVTEETYRVFYRDALEDISAWLAGNPVRQLNTTEKARR